MAKITLLTAGAVGYVLGARAGRERYDQIAQQARKVWRDPRVQQRKDEAASAVKEGVTDAAHQAADAARSKVSSATSSAGSAGSTTGSTGENPLADLADPTPPSGATGAGSASTGPVPDPAADPSNDAGQRDDSFPSDPRQPGHDA